MPKVDNPQRPWGHANRLHAVWKEYRRLAVNRRRSDLPATRTTTAETSFISTNASKSVWEGVLVHLRCSPPIRFERWTILSVTWSTLPTIFSPDRKCNSTDLPALP